MIGFLALSGPFAVLPTPTQTTNNLCGKTIAFSISLTTNLHCDDQGVTIGGNGVIYNCNGNQITGNGGGRGITILAVNQVTVENCKVSDFQIGIYLNGPATQDTITGNTANGNTFAGFYCTGGDTDTWTSNSASSNQWGFYFTGCQNYGAPGNTISSNIASSNTNGGFFLGASYSNTLSGNIANDNTGYGFQDNSNGSGTAGTGNTYTGNNCNGNTSGGSSPTGLCSQISTITQPITASLVSSGTQQTIAIDNSCNPSPPSFLGDGISHDVTMNPSCAFAMSLPPGYQFVGGNGKTTCPSGLCNPYTTTYEESPPSTASVAISANGLGTGASGNVITIDGTAYQVSQLPLSFTWVVGSSHSYNWYTTINPGSTIEYVWSASSGCGQSSSSGTIVVPSGGCTHNAIYVPFYQVTFLVNPTGGGTVSWSGGGSSPGSTTTSGASYYYGGTSISIGASSSTYQFQSWSSSGAISVSGTSASTSATVNGAGTITANFVAPPTYQVTFSATGLGSDASGNLLVVDGAYYQVSQLPRPFFWTAGSSHSFAWYSDVVGSSGNDESIWSSTAGCGQSGLSGTIVVSSSCTVTGTYSVAYFVIFVVSPQGDGTVTASGGGNSGSTTSSMKLLYYAGSSPSISAQAVAGYVLNGWSSSTSSISIANPSSATTSVTINGPGTITANFAVSLPQTAAVTFSASGLGSLASGPALTVDGASYSATQLPQQFTWVVGSSHSFTWVPTVGGNANTEYVWESTSGCDQNSYSGNLVVPSLGCTISATYSPLYRVTFSVAPSGAGTVSWSGGANSAGSTSSSSASWYQPGSTVSIEAQSTGGYAFNGWTSSTPSILLSSSSSLVTTATINGPGTITATYQPQQGFEPLPNWAGYVAESSFSNPQPTVMAIAGSWVVQTVQTTQQDQRSSQWIGIGGFQDPTLIQVGTSSNSESIFAPLQCFVTCGQYFAWYELLRNGPEVIGSLEIQAGDHITASIACTASCRSSAQSWLITIQDMDSRVKFSQTVTYPSSMLSAEWIDERPAKCIDCSNYYPLAEFDKAASFSGSSVTFLPACSDICQLAPTGAIAQFPHIKIDMATSPDDCIGASTTGCLAETSDLSFGESFMVTWVGPGARLQ